ncbi:MAG: hypothetical protein P4L82_16745 [Ancalomicrobiaceae bacterium]|nr:hypothetical protein [Ancalomicrobiaceae bacterium]
MNAHAQTIEAPVTALIIAEPAKALTSREIFSRFKTELEKEVDAHIPDLTTDKGRKAIASLAFRVTKAKTAIDDAGKKLTEDMRKQVDVINAERKFIRDDLEALATKARKPLTDWEKSEELRLALVLGIKTKITTLGIILANATSMSIAAAIDDLDSIKIMPDVFLDDEWAVRSMVETSRANLTNALERIKRDEADRAELAKLRAEAEAREIAERERIAAEAKAKADEEAIELRRVAEAKAKELAEEAERKRIADAAEKARVEAIAEEQRKARVEQAERDRIAAEALAKANAEKAELERQMREQHEKAERERIEAEARAADIEHRGSTMRAVKEAIMAVGEVSEPAAKAIVKAIIAGQIPNTTITF